MYLLTAIILILYTAAFVTYSILLATFGIERNDHLQYIALVAILGAVFLWYLPMRALADYLPTYLPTLF